MYGVREQDEDRWEEENTNELNDDLLTESSWDPNENDPNELIPDQRELLNKEFTIKRQRFAHQPTNRLK